MIKLIVGLGNPGEEYESTYHNAGFLAIDYLEEKLIAEKKADRRRPPKNIWIRESLFRYRVAGPYTLIKPLTFMNQSGEAVKKALRYFRSTSEEMLVIHDDFDIPLGEAKQVFDRGSAGHQGVESIIRALRTKAFWRLRLGVRKKPGKAGLFALARISASDKKILYSVLSGIITKSPENDTPPGLVTIASKGRFTA